MPESPLVSVIIPAYNRASTIRRAVDSVLSQTYAYFEIVVVDDGSTDGTLEVVRELNDPRIRTLRHEKNRGPAAARNTAMDNAKGFYLALLDSDDEWLPNKLEEQLAALRNAGARVRACTTGVIMIQGDLVRDHLPEPIVPLQKKLMWACDFCPGTTLMVERAIFSEIGGMDELLPRYQDWDWLIRYADHNELLVVNQFLAKVYRNTRPAPERVEKAAIRLLDKHRERFKSFGPAYEHKVISRRWREVAQEYYEAQRNLPKERLYFWRAIWNDPIQPPGVYLSFLDSLLGTKLKPLASRVKARLLRREPK